MTRPQTKMELVIAGLAGTVVWAAGLLAIAGVVILGFVLAAGAFDEVPIVLAVPVSVGLGVVVAMGLLALPMARRGKVPVSSSDNGRH